MRRSMPAACGAKSLKLAGQRLDRGDASVRIVLLLRFAADDPFESHGPEQLQGPQLEVSGARMDGRAPMAFNVERRNPVPREEYRRREADQASTHDQHRDVLARWQTSGP